MSKDLARLPFFGMRCKLVAGNVLHSMSFLQAG